MTVIPWYTAPFTVPSTNREYPFSYRCLRTAISVFSHKLRTDVPGELINLLQARYFVYERMLFHPTKCVAGALLGAAIQFVGWRRVPEHLWYVGDAVFLHELEEATKIVRDLLAGESREALYNRAKANQLQQKLVSESGTAIAARAIFADRVLTVKSLRDHLEMMRHLPQHRDSATACTEALKNEAEETDFDAAVLLRIEGHLRGQTDAVELARRAQPTIGAIHSDLRAALRLLARLRARRYHRIIFRMLPDVHVTGLRDLTVEQIAATFLDPHVRKLAEREIESRVNPNLPVGSIVIHCPPAAGPAKLANILITDGQTNAQGCPTNAARLREIGTLNRKIFGEHQHSVTALERMYQSTWRLAVSVARPHEAKWEEIADVTGKVIFEVLSGGDVLAGKVPNDLYLERELKLQSAPSLDGTRPEELEFDFAKPPDGSLAAEVLDTLRGSGKFDDVLNQGDFNPEKFLDRIFSRKGVAGDGAALEKLFPTPQTIDEFLDQYIDPDEVSRADLPSHRRLKRDLLNLGPLGQRFSRDRIRDFLPEEGLKHNRSMLHKLVDIVAEAKGHDSPENK